MEFIGGGVGKRSTQPREFDKMLNAPRLQRRAARLQCPDRGGRRRRREPGVCGAAGPRRPLLRPPAGIAIQGSAYNKPLAGLGPDSSINTKRLVEI
ncbi:hypothetical protein Y1Q_0010655 [Alligator mississippiensis]|uniref:Uncharacterized protein n=1 Tax=Alligator mississippiensis TaxID=8496 RepID=A0A151M6B6_ALLMI|nr:hypothetical protein Y1Q_0010655 [Alligator mississippiensis]